MTSSVQGPSLANNVGTDLSVCRCTCCNALHVGYIGTSGNTYCDRCEVAYLEFKLELLLAVCRASWRTDEV